MKQKVFGDVAILYHLHPLVDACSVSVLVRGGMSWQRVLAYNALAFAPGLFARVSHDGRDPFWGY